MKKRGKILNDIERIDRKEERDFGLMLRRKKEEKVKKRKEINESVLINSSEKEKTNQS